ncbi:MAG: hypothetical protein K2W85_02955 [Phycisphaerales bacterium]|nr:hypothetical protein [Phycisphaerales bacterium]
MSTPPPNNPLLRNLGAFVGHIWQGVRSDPTPPPPTPQNAEPPQPPPSPDQPAKAIRQVSQEHEITTPEGKLILRRTIIDEVEQHTQTKIPPSPQP